MLLRFFSLKMENLSTREQIINLATKKLQFFSILKFVTIKESILFDTNLIVAIIYTVTKDLLSQKTEIYKYRN